jgi:multidrug efflux system outer membrane protein
MTRARPLAITVAAGAAAFALLALLGGCALGPDYERPESDPPAGFRTAEAVTATAASLADLPWWEVFHDDTLTSLIREAIANNYDARIAVARIEQANGGVWVARADFLPHAAYEAFATRGANTFLLNPFPGGVVASSPFFLGALTAAWEIDVWGRIRRSTEAAKAALLASEEGRRAIWLSLVSEVGGAYFELLELDAELEIARRNTASFRESYRIFDLKLKGGVGSKLETARAEGALASAAATIPDIERQIAQKENEINYLLGRAPGPITRTATLLGSRGPPEIPSGIPSMLLERRPDIREAEQELVAANAQVGVALTNFFPKIGLSAIAGAASVELNDLTRMSSGLWGVGATMAGPLFQGGALLGRYKAAKGFRLEQELRYEQAVVAALREVSDALIAGEKLKEEQEEVARAVIALDDAVTVSIERYQAGQSSYYEVLEAQQQRFPAETTLARITRDRLLIIVQLYKALGGGWHLDDESFASGRERPPP